MLFVEGIKVEVCNQSAFIMQNQATSHETQGSTGRSGKVSRLDAALLLQYPAAALKATASAIPADIFMQPV